MKKPVRTSKRNFFSGMLFGFFVVALMVSTIGCSKSDKNSNPYYNGAGGIYGWGNGSSSGGLNAVGNDLSSSLVELALHISVSGATPASIYYANGQVIAQGDLKVVQPIQCGTFTLAPGRYAVSSNAPAQVVNGVISGMSLIGSGNSVQIQMNLTQAVVFESYPKMYSCYGPQVFDELSGRLMIQAVNNMPCMQSIYIQTYQTQPVCR